MSVVYVFMKNQNWGQKPLFVLDKSKLEKKRLKVVKKSQTENCATAILWMIKFQVNIYIRPPRFAQFPFLVIEKSYFCSIYRAVKRKISR